LGTYSNIKLDLDTESVCQQANWLEQKLEVGTRQLQAKALIDAYHTGGYSLQ
jgi:hypothetical protein